MTPTQRAAAERIIAAWEPHRGPAVIEDDVGEYHEDSLAMVLVACEVVGKDMAVALAWFLEDDRFQVGVGGNPNVVERMLDCARAVLAAFRELNQCP